MKYLRPLMVMLLVQWAHTANLPCRICSPDSPDRSCIPDESMPPIEGVRVQSSICSDIENNHKEYHNKLCEKYPKPNGYYYECTVPGTSNTFSCRSSCGPPLEEVGKGLNLDLLKGGGLFGTFNSRPQNRGADLFDFNNFNNDKSRGNTNFGSFATLGSFNNNNNNFNLFNTQGARTGNGNSRSNLRTQGRTSNSLGGGAAEDASVTSGGGRQRGSNSGGTSSFTSSSSSFSGGGTTNNANFANANLAGRDGKTGISTFDLGSSSSATGNSGLGLFGNNAAGSSSVNNNNNNAFNLPGGTVGTNNKAFNFDSNGFGVGSPGFSWLGGNGRNSGSVVNTGRTAGSPGDVNSRDFNKNFDLSTLKPVESQRVFDDYFNNFNNNFQTGFDNLLKSDKQSSGTTASQSRSASDTSGSSSTLNGQSSDSTIESSSGLADANSNADSNYESDVQQDLKEGTTGDPLSYITPVDSLGVYPPKSEDVLQAPPVGGLSQGHAEHSPGVAPPQEEEGAVTPPVAGEETPEESGASNQEGAPEVPISGGISGGSTLPQGPPALNQVPPDLAQVPPQQPGQGAPDSAAQPPPIEIYPQGAPAETAPQLPPAPGSEVPENYAYDQLAADYAREELAQDNPSEGPYSAEQGDSVEGLPGQEVGQNYDPNAETPKQVYPGVPPPPDAYPTDLSSDEVYPNGEAPQTNQSPERYTDSPDPGAVQGGFPLPSQTNPEAAYPQGGGQSPPNPDQPQPPQDGSYPQSAGPSSGYPDQPQPPQDGSYPQSAGPSSGYPEQPQPPQDDSYLQSAGPSSGYPEQPQPPQDGSYPQSAGPSSGYPEQPQPPQDGSYPQSAGPSSGYPDQPQPPQNGSYPQSAGPSSGYPDQTQPLQDGSYPQSAGPSSGYPEQPQPPQNGPQGGGVARTPDVPDSSAADPYTPPANQYTPSASSDPAGSSVQGVALPSYSKKYPADGSSPDSSGASGYPPAGQAQSSPQKLPGSSPQPGSENSLSAYEPSSDSQGALDAYESAKKDGGLTPTVVDAGSRGDSADPMGSGDGGKRAGYPVVVVDEGRKADVSRNTPTAPSQGLPPAINDVPDKKSQGQNSQTNVQFSSSSNDPNNNQLPPEAFQNPFNNPSSPFSRRTDQFESNPAFVGTSLFSEGFLDSPDRVISAGPKQRGPDAVDIGGYQIFPGFQQFEKTGDTDALGVNNNNNRQNNIFSLFTQPANQPTGQSVGAFGFGSSNPGRNPTPNNGFNGFSNGGRSTQTAGGVFDPNFLSNPGRSNFINPRQRFTGVLPGPSYSQAPGNGGFNNGFANQANNAPARFPANPAYPGAGGGSTRPSQTLPSFPGPQPAPGRGGPSPFRNFGGTSNPSAGTGGFPTSGGRAGFGAAGFPSYGGGATSGAAGFPSSGGGATSGAAGFPSSGGGATLGLLAFRLLAVVRPLGLLAFRLLAVVLRLHALA